MLAEPCILSVEDEPGIADTLAYALATEGFEPQHFATRRRGLEWLAQQQAALVIPDVGCPT